MATLAPDLTAPLTDSFGRQIRYLRVSVTDRCDFRCRYCMAEAMTFLPRAEILALEEIAIIVDRFIARGVTKVRLTGGEPLVRRGVGELAARIGRHLGRGLEELTLTTNGSRLAEQAEAMVDAGIRRINVSLDSLDRDRFAYITRRDRLNDVLAGIAAARAAGLAVKINMVALKGLNEDEIEPMLRWCAAEGHDLSLIETMPLGRIDEDRSDRFLPLTLVRKRLDERFTLTPSSYSTGGPARYWTVEELGVRLGLISPLTENFCAGCNRVRLTVEGRLFMCLGQEDQVDLKAAYRTGGIAAVDRAIDDAMRRKPLRHDFRIAAARPAVARHMSVTGG
ncbi:MAG: cyclic pyranopterin phosphate synthase MoaA [Sphingomonas sp. SCN 67-18]|uniref:GTP 3',8-cyclase MoaA n=1 Tax=uncultured Sphingomonas sp. TaxID=158754 RepID=UPI00086B1AAD|nr:GTP 3',8-cyclase MoaA [Sphingomonas sp. SCN 67-18]ODU21524.1 MAG: cyclic pyranopterin phosphate synthase MoaA [Sphingomonas sp. SCN 67-18]